MVQFQSGKLIPTVTGDIIVKNLGVTLMHEHLLVNPQNDDKKYDPYRLMNLEKAIEEIRQTKTSGVSTIVDMTPLHYGRDVEGLKKIAEMTGCNVLTISGFHKEEFLPNDIAHKTINELSEIIMKDIQDGIDGTSIKPALLKFGTSGNIITVNELKCMNAVCAVHHKTSLPISTHCDYGLGGLEQVQYLIEQKVNLSRVILGHIDMCENEEYVFELLQTGVNIQFDHIGRTIEHDQWVLQCIEKIYKSGRIHQFYLSQDMGKQDYLKSYDGYPGLDYLSTTFKEKFTKMFGEELFDEILVSNVRKYFEK